MQQVRAITHPLLMFTWTFSLTLALLAVTVLVLGYSLGGLAYGWLGFAVLLIALWFGLRRRNPTGI